MGSTRCEPKDIGLWHEVTGPTAPSRAAGSTTGLLPSAQRTVVRFRVPSKVMDSTDPDTVVAPGLEGLESALQFTRPTSRASRKPSQDTGTLLVCTILELATVAATKSKVTRGCVGVVVFITEEVQS